jgi:hypothetical protein
MYERLCAMRKQCLYLESSTPMKTTVLFSDHLSRRRLMKGALAAAAGGLVMNWGGLVNSTALAAETKKQRKHCILLWMNGGESQFETFDRKSGRPTGG